MSDIRLSFSVWEVPLLLGLVYWPAFLLAGAVLAILAIYVRGWMRGGLLGLAAIALLPCVMVVCWGFLDAVHSMIARRDYARVHEVLSAPMRIQNLDFPPGSAVTWSDERHQAVVSVDLPGPTPLLGATLTGKLEDMSGLWWSGTLAVNAQIAGWPCAAGDVWLAHDGQPLRCTLSADYQHQGLAIPAGSAVAMTASGQLDEVRIPADRTMVLPSVGATLPGHGSLFLRPNGSVIRAYVQEPAVLRVDETALIYEIGWLYPENADLDAATPVPAVALRGELAAATTIEDAVVPAGSLVMIDLASRVVRVRPQR